MDSRPTLNAHKIFFQIRNDVKWKKDTASKDINMNWVLPHHQLNALKASPSNDDDNSNDLSLRLLATKIGDKSTPEERALKDAAIHELRIKSLDHFGWVPSKKRDPEPPHIQKSHKKY